MQARYSHLNVQGSDGSISVTRRVVIVTTFVGSVVLVSFVMACVALSNANATAADLDSGKSSATKEYAEVMTDLRSMQLSQATLQGSYTSMNEEMNRMDTTMLNLNSAEAKNEQDVASATSNMQSLTSSVNALTSVSTAQTAQIAQLDSQVATAESAIACQNNVGVLPGSNEPTEHNGHYYQWVEAPYYSETSNFAAGITFEEAQMDAHSRCYNSMTGYLVTITDQAEQTFVETLIPTHTNDFTFVGWIGAADQATEGHWVWTNGPEKNQQFWQGASSESGGVAYPAGAYTNWYCRQVGSWNYCEPNNGNNQDCGHMYGNGYWNDVSCNLRTQGYFVEYS